MKVYGEKYITIFRCAKAPLKLAVSRLVSGLVGNAVFDYAHGTPIYTFESAP